MHRWFKGGWTPLKMLLKAEFTLKRCATGIYNNLLKLIVILQLFIANNYFVLLPKSSVHPTMNAAIDITHG